MSEPIGRIRENRETQGGREPKEEDPSTEAQRTGKPIAELGDLMRESSALVEAIREGGVGARRRMADEEGRLAAEIESSREEARTMVEAIATLERRTTQLIRLYVATYQLYLRRDPAQVYEAVAEVASDVLGAERFALLVRTGDGLGCRVVLRHGIVPGAHDIFGADSYSGGHEALDQALTDGVRWIGSGSSELVAVVPLQVDDVVLGVLAIVELVGHKSELDDSDRELLDLLGAHAASALLSSVNASLTERRLKTMTRLLQLLIEDSRDS